MIVGETEGGLARNESIKPKAISGRIAGCLMRPITLILNESFLSIIVLEHFLYTITPLNNFFSVILVTYVFLMLGRIIKSQLKSAKKKSDDLILITFTLI